MSYTYDQLTIGDVFISPTRTITESDVMQFAGLTCDYNELHTSVTFAENTKFGKRIAHGMLTLSIANGLYARINLFNSSVFLGIKELKFLHPVYLGDTIHLRMTVIEKRLTKDGNRAVLGLKYDVLNQRDEVTLEGIFNRMINVDA